MKSTIAKSPELLTIKDVSAALNCSERHVWRLVKQGDLLVMRHGRMTRIPERSLKHFISINIADTS